MITIFSCPKPFSKKIGIIQTNAVNSWKRLDPKIQIILVGNDDTIKDFSLKAKIDFIDNVDSNKYGTPYISSIFELAERKSRFDTLVYLNSDIILFGDFMETIRSIEKSFNKFLAIGQRYDTQIDRPINFSDQKVVATLYKSARKTNKKHGYAGMDYFVFKKKTFGKLPNFLVGRDCWDNWMIYNALKRKIRVLDATNRITALHQDHDFSHLKNDQQYREELDSNYILAKGRMATMNDADYRIKADLSLSKNSRLRRIVNKYINILRFNLFYVYLYLSKFFKALKQIDLVWKKGQEDVKITPVPWIPFKARRKLNRILKKTDVVFEWGSGGSTLYFAGKVDRVYSAEHDKMWFDKVAGELDKRGISNCIYWLIPPQRGIKKTDLSYKSNDIEYKNFNFRDYCLSINKFPDRFFNLIFVDGRARNSALRVAYRKVRKGGYIILDNSERTVYRQGMNFLRKKGFREEIIIGKGPFNNYPWQISFYQK